MAPVPPGLLDDPAIAASGASTDLAGVRIAIVTYELVGLTRTGGIGTAYTALAHALAAAGATVDVLFTGWPSPGVDVAAALAEHERGGVHVELLEAGAADWVASPSEHERRAYAALAWLRARAPYAVVHAPECGGHGAAIAAAKRAGVAFAGSEIVIGAHGSSRWVKELDDEPFVAPEQLLLDALERRSIEDADAVVSPSAYLVDVMRRRGWRLPPRTFVEQYIVPPAAGRPVAPAGGPLRELVFFGRWETRKGFPLLLDALDLLVGRIGPDALRVTFLGRPDLIDGEPAEELLRRRGAAWPWPIEALTSLDQPEALEYLRAPGRLAVMPSLADNLPLTVLEALALGVPFLTTATGGIPELIDTGDLDWCASRADAPALADALERALGAPARAPRFAVDPGRTREAHLRWHHALAARAAGAPAPPPAGRPAPVATLGGAAPPEPGDYVVLRSPDHALDPDAADRLAGAARASGADVVTYPVRGPGGVLRPPVGGAPVLAGAAHVLSTGGALVRAALIDGVPADERGLELTLARLALTGARILVFPDPVASVAERADPSPAAWVTSWWPTPAGVADAHAVARAFAAGPAPELADLAAIAAGLAGDATRLRADLARAQEIADRFSVTIGQAQRLLAEHHDTVERRNLELADTVSLLRRAEADLDSERRRLATLRGRRAVRVALRLADIGARLRR